MVVSTLADSNVHLLFQSLLEQLQVFAFLAAGV